MGELAIHVYHSAAAHMGALVKAASPDREVVVLSDRTALAAALTGGRAFQVRQARADSERLARVLQARSPEFTLCHSDVHAGNLLIGADDAFYIVDWDSPILAPKERDLMFIGGGLMGAWRAPREEEALFYRGYGATRIDPVAS